MVVYDRWKGVRSSSVLVLFWLFYLVFGILRLVSVIRQAVKEVKFHHFKSIVLFYPLEVIYDYIIKEDHTHTSNRFFKKIWACLSEFNLNQDLVV